MSWGGALVDFKDGVSFTGAGNSDTTPSFTLLGGKYGLAIYSSTTASVVLNISADNTHFVACGSAVTAYGVFDLPAGTYQMVLGGSAGTAAGALLPIPYKPA